MKRVGIYNRCSTEEESQRNALAIQAEESREIAVSKQWMIVEQYIESESGTTSVKRKEYLRMMQDIEEKRFDIIMIKSIDRLARNAKDWYLFLDCLVRNQTRLYLYLDHRFYQQDDALLTGIKAILAEQFSKDLSQKIKNAHRRRQNKRSGLNITRPMFGWERIGRNEYEVCEKEKEYFRIACDLVEQGYGYRRITNTMFELGARQKNGKRISDVLWRNMLRSPRAHGTVILHQEEYDFEQKKRVKLPETEWIFIENALPPLISKEYHDKLIGILDKNAQKTDSRKARVQNHGKHILSGKIKCAECGASYYRIMTGRQPEWKCAKRIKEGMKKGCDNVKLEEEELYKQLEMVCRKEYAALYSKTDGIQEELEILLKRTFDDKKVRKEAQEIEKRMEILQESKTKLLKKLLADVISDADYKQYYEKMIQEETALDIRYRKIQEEMKQYNKQKERIMQIKEAVEKEGIIEKAKTEEAIKKIDTILVEKDRTLKITFHAVR